MAETDVPNRGPQIKAAAYTMLILATIAVALRFWSRHISQKAGFWWDDWFALIALVRRTHNHLNDSADQIIRLKAFRMGEQRGDNLLGPHWPREAHQAGAKSADR